MIFRVLTLLLALCGSASAQLGQIPTYVVPAPSGSAYAGPGDIVPGAVYWYGLRGYSAAYAAPGTNCAVDIEDQAGGNLFTCVHILSSGDLDVATISAWVAAHSVTTIYAVKLYDQSGNGAHITTASGLTANPTIALNAIGSKPALAYAGGQAQGATVTTQSQPATISGAIKINTGSSGGLAGVFSPNTTFGPGGNAGQIIIGGIGGGGGSFVSDTFGTFKVYQGVYNDNASSIKVDAGAPTVFSSGQVGTSGLGTLNLVGADTNSTFLTGNILDIGWWPSAISPTNQGLLNAQSHAYWGF